MQNLFRRQLCLIMIVMVISLNVSAVADTLENNVWVRRSYVDEFNDPTGNEYASTRVDGTFSNTATQNSEISVVVIVDTDSVSFMIYEYNSYRVSNTFSKAQEYQVLVKEPDGTTHEYIGTIQSGSDRISLSFKDSYALKDLLKNLGTFRFAIYEGGNSVTEYHFSINSDGFEDAAGLSYVGEFHNGLAPIIQNNMVGCIDTTGTIVAPCEWDYVGIYQEGLICVFKGTYINLDGGYRMTDEGKFGFIDGNGAIIIPCDYDMAFDYSNGLALVKKNGKYGFIDKHGESVIACEYDYARPFSDECAVTFIGSLNQNGYPLKGQYSIFNTEGQIITSGEWEATGSLFCEGFLSVMKDGKYGFLNQAGEMAIDYQWDRADSFSGGLAAVLKDGKWGYIDSTGILLVPCSIEAKFIGSYSDGLAYICNEDYMYGFIDRTGEIIIPAKWDYVLPFSNGVAAVRDSDKKWGLIDKQGHTVAKCEWDGMQVYDNMICVRKFTSSNPDNGNGIGGVYGFINTSGKIVIPCEYDYAVYSEGLFTLSKNGVINILDTEGNIVF